MDLSVTEACTAQWCRDLHRRHWRHHNDDGRRVARNTLLFPLPYIFGGSTAGVQWHHQRHVVQLEFKNSSFLHEWIKLTHNSVELQHTAVHFPSGRSGGETVFFSPFSETNRYCHLSSDPAEHDGTGWGGEGWRRRWINEQRLAVVHWEKEREREKKLRWKFWYLERPTWLLQGRTHTDRRIYPWGEGGDMGGRDSWECVAENNKSCLQDWYFWCVFSSSSAQMLNSKLDVFYFKFLFFLFVCLFAFKQQPKWC